MAKDKDAELGDKLWKALESDRTVMLGLAGVEEGHSQPMTAQLTDADPSGAIWFFSAKDVDLVKALGAAAGPSRILRRKDTISSPRSTASSRPSTIAR